MVQVKQWTSKRGSLIGEMICSLIGITSHCLVLARLARVLHRHTFCSNIKYRQSAHSINYYYQTS